MARLRRFDRMVSILRVFVLYRDIGEPGEIETYPVPLTVTRVARLLGLKPSTHLLKILLEMVHRGWLIVEHEPYRTNFRVHLFFLTGNGHMFYKATKELENEL